MSAALRYVSKADIPENLYLVGVTVERRRPINGGYSDVFRGTFAETGDAVAIKRMRYTEDDDEANKQSDKALEKEVTMLMKLKKHPNIVRFLGLVTYDETPCIVTLWAPKGSLAKCQKSAGSVHNKEKIIIEVASALAFLHSGKGMEKSTHVVVHGDLHPDNIFIGHDGVARLADFGICKVIPRGMQASTSLRPGAPAGRIAYVAPELHGTGLRGVESDVFSFGMLVYEVLGGNLSALGGTHLDIAGVIKGGRRPERFDRLSANVWSIVKNCWEADPTKRPTMETVLERLKKEWPADASAVEAYAQKWLEEAAKAQSAVTVAVKTTAGAA